MSVITGTCNICQRFTNVNVCSFTQKTVCSACGVYILREDIPRLRINFCPEWVPTVLDSQDIFFTSRNFCQILSDRFVSRYHDLRKISAECISEAVIEFQNRSIDSEQSGK